MEEKEGLNYNIIIEKTVKDLFRFSDIKHIKSVKKLKDQEVEKEEQRLKSLMLEKYSLLVSSIEKVSLIKGNLKELIQIKEVLTENLNKSDDHSVVYNDMQETYERLPDWHEMLSNEVNTNNSCSNTINQANNYKTVYEYVDLLRKGYNTNVIIDSLLRMKNGKGSIEKDFSYRIALSEIFDCLIKEMIDINATTVNDEEKDIEHIKILLLVNYLCNNNVDNLDSEGYDIIKYDQTTDSIYKRLFSNDNEFLKSEKINYETELNLEDNEENVIELKGVMNSIMIYVKIKLVRLQGYLIEYNIERIMKDFLIMINTINFLLNTYRFFITKNENKDENIFINRVCNQKEYSELFKRHIYKHFEYLSSLINSDFVKEYILSNKKNLKRIIKNMNDILDWLYKISHEKKYISVFENTNTIIEYFESIFIEGICKTHSNLLKKLMNEGISEEIGLKKNYNIILLCDIYTLLLKYKNDYEAWKRIFGLIKEFLDNTVNSAIKDSEKMFLYDLFYNNLLFLFETKEAKENMSFLYTKIHILTEEIINNKVDRLKIEIIEGISYVRFMKWNDRRSDFLRLNELISNSLCEVLYKIYSVLKYISKSEREEKYVEIKRNIFNYLLSEYMKYMENNQFVDKIGEIMLNDIYFLKELTKKMNNDVKLEGEPEKEQSIPEEINIKLATNNVFNYFSELNLDKALEKDDFFKKSKDNSIFKNEDLSSFFNSSFPNTLSSSLRNYIFYRSLNYLNYPDLIIKVGGSLKKDSSFKILFNRIDENYQSIMKLNSNHNVGSVGSNSTQQFTNNNSKAEGKNIFSSLFS